MPPLITTSENLMKKQVSLEAAARADNMIDLITFEEMKGMVSREYNLRGTVNGYISEYWVEKNLLNTLYGIHSVVKPPDSKSKTIKSDRTFIYAPTGREYTLQMKSVRTTRLFEKEEGDEIKRYDCTIDVSSKLSTKVLPDGRSVRTGYCLKTNFDILGISLHAMTGNPNDFAFIRSRDCRSPTGRWGRKPDLPEDTVDHFIGRSEPFTWPDMPPGWTTDLLSLLDDTIGVPIENGLNYDNGTNNTTEASIS